jgi:hypothetical protein
MLEDVLAEVDRAREFRRGIRNLKTPANEVN